MSSELAVLDLTGAKTGSVSWPKGWDKDGINTDVIHQATVMYQANVRQGNASTKERGSVRGGGRKPFAQKGTGRARQGSTRSPLSYSGGAVFGPHPHHLAYRVPRKDLQASLREVLKSKFQEGKIICLTDISQDFKKTKEFAGMLKKLSIKGKILALLDGSADSVHRVSRNIARFEIMRAQDVTSYDLMRYTNLLLTQTAFKNLMERIES